MKWNKLITRPLTDEEREIYGPYIDYMWDGECPEIYEEVIVCDERKNIFMDNWLDFGDGVGFENVGLEKGETVYWMSLPEPPKELLKGE